MSKPTPQEYLASFPFAAQGPFGRKDILLALQEYGDLRAQEERDKVLAELRAEDIDGWFMERCTEDHREPNGEFRLVESFGHLVRPWRYDCSQCRSEALARARAQGSVQREALLEALNECVTTMDHAKVFVTSRERIKSPEGEELYDAALAKAQGVIFATRQSWLKTFGGRHAVEAAKAELQEVQSLIHRQEPKAHTMNCAVSQSRACDCGAMDKRES